MAVNVFISLFIKYMGLYVIFVCDNVRQSCLCSLCNTAHHMGRSEQTYRYRQSEVQGFCPVAGDTREGKVAAKLRGEICSGRAGNVKS
jgi:hypothetical protein